MPTLSELLNPIAPFGAQRNAAIQARQNADWKIARASMTAASEALADGDNEAAIAHALVGILATAMSEL